MSTVNLGRVNLMITRELIIKVSKFESAKIPEGEHKCSTYAVKWEGHTFYGVRPGDWLCITSDARHWVYPAEMGDLWFGDLVEVNAAPIPEWVLSGVPLQWSGGEVCFDCPCGAEEIIISGPGYDELCECGRVYRVQHYVEEQVREGNPNADV